LQRAGRGAKKLERCGARDPEPGADDYRFADWNPGTSAGEASANECELAGEGIRSNAEINVSVAMAVKDGVVGAVIHKANAAKIAEISALRGN